MMKMGLKKLVRITFSSSGKKSKFQSKSVRKKNKLKVSQRRDVQY